jgi:threonine synthase
VLIPKRPPRFDELILPPGIGRITLGEGETPLLAVDGALLKCEHLNPTGSYKDRIASVAISIGSAAGAKGWIGTSSGNAGAAFAAYGARARMRGWLLTVDGVSAEKLAHVRAFDTEVWELERFGRDPEVDAEVFRLVARLAEAENLTLGITARAYNEAAMDGIKTIAFELIDELGAAPGAVYVPTGGGGLIASLAAGFAQARELGLSQRLPRLVAVQPEGCAPIHLAARRGREHVAPVGECRSEISGLRLTNPPDGDLALQAVLSTQGWTAAISDEDALTTQRALAAEHGILVEPAAALAFAGYQTRPVEDAVVLMTGNGLKALGDADASTPPRRLALEAIPSLVEAVAAGRG